MSDAFHQRPFDEGTLTKLQLFRLYARQWLPVFLSRPEPRWPALHLYDFFAGPGSDANGTPGSPLLLLEELRRVQGLPGWPSVKVAAHFFDESEAKIAALRTAVVGPSQRVPGAALDIEVRPFESAWPLARPILRDPESAKLVLIDQYGVDYVSDEVFREVISFPTCDMLFFISSSTLYRFRDHPAIKQRITRPDDYYHVHRAVTNYYRGLVPADQRYFLGRFSIKKGTNIYGVIFGSSHPRGMDKFLEVAWAADSINGEADFDINRDDCGPLFSQLVRPTKIMAFESELAERLRSGVITNEGDVIDLCFQHGVKRQHSASVLKALKAEGAIECDFRVPDITRLREPRPITLPNQPKLI